MTFSELIEQTRIERDKTATNSASWLTRTPAEYISGCPSLPTALGTIGMSACGLSGVSLLLSQLSGKQVATQLVSVLLRKRFT